MARMIAVSEFSKPVEANIEVKGYTDTKDGSDYISFGVEKADGTKVRIGWIDLRSGTILQQFNGGDFKALGLRTTPDGRVMTYKDYSERRYDS